jgi:hypothetical protein
MVAQHSKTPGDPPRLLSEAVRNQLELALRASADRAPDGEELLRAAVQAAATEGRERGLRPEELVVALKTVEERIEPSGSRKEDERSTFRLRLIRALLDAYYRD